MTPDNRAMTVAQARMLAADVRLSPAVMVRLANSHPEVWPVLLENPSLYPELRQWLVAQLVAEEPAQPSLSEIPSSSSSAQPQRSVNVPSQEATKLVPRRNKGARRKKRRSQSARLAGIIVPPVLVIAGLFALAGVVFADHDEPGVIATQEILTAPPLKSAWEYDISTIGKSKCAQHSFKEFEQDLTLVLIQNNLSLEECRDQEKPAPSTLALVNTRSGEELWKVDLAAEVSWTTSWRKEIIAAPGLNEIILKLTDVNGADAGGEKKSVDKNDDRKMKTLIPINKLNGRITDPVIAQSEGQPTMQAPVVEVLALPGDSLNVLVMSNGADKDFRYALHRAKDLSSSEWSYESDLKPIGGNAVVQTTGFGSDELAGLSLILGRDTKDDPVALRIKDGEPLQWGGPAGGKLYRIAGALVHIEGDGSTDKVTNVIAQGGKDGHDVTLRGIDNDGKRLWTLETHGYAIGRYSASSTMVNRNDFAEIFALSGGGNRTMESINPRSGKPVWTQKLTADQFEVSKLVNDSFGFMYLTAEGDDQSKQLATLSLSDGKLGPAIDIEGAAVRVDGVSQNAFFVVDEPERKRIISDAESGLTSNSDDDGKDNSAESRTCLRVFSTRDSAELWSLTCNGNEHITNLSGNWMIVDKTPGHEQLRPLLGQAK